MIPSLDRDQLRKRTLPGLLLERAGATPDDVAYRAKKRGIYRERTWIEFRDKVAQCALGLRRVGLKRGERIALMGDPCEEYTICELAALALGAVPYGIYASSPQKQLKDLLEDGGAVVFVAENQEYVDLITPIAGDLKDLQHIMVIDTQGITLEDSSSYITFDKIMQRGKGDLLAHPGLFKELAGRVRPEDIAFIIYTAGTTGPPKGVMVSHGRHLAAASTLLERYPVLHQRAHRTIVSLPMSGVMGKTGTLTLPLITRIVPHYGESIEVLSETLFETAPTILITVPALLKKVATHLFGGIENSSPLKKWCYRKALSHGRRTLEKVWEGKMNALSALLHRFYRLIVFNRILNKIGMNRLKLVLTSDTSPGTDLILFWQALGLNLCEFYTQTEAGGGIISAQSSPFPRPGHVGSPPEAWEVALSEDGEILVKSQDLFEGYWEKPDLTGTAVDKEGWLHTGDLGKWTPEGDLEFVGRREDLELIREGEPFNPNRVEKALKSSPYISEAIALRPEGKPVSALLEVEFERVATWARFQDLSYGEYSALVERPEIIEHLEGEVGKANQQLASHERVRRFSLLPYPLSAGEDDSPLTATRKVRRGMIPEIFGGLLETMHTV